MANGTGPSGGDDGSALATQKGGVQTLGQLVTVAQRECFTLGNVIAVNNIGTSLIGVFAQPTTPINWIVFHNPSNTVELLVGLTSSGAFSFASRGGSFLLVPGDYLPFSGNVSAAWSAIAQSGSGNPLTIITAPQ